MLRAVQVPTPHGRLEALLEEFGADEVQPRAAAVVCPPHPALGGTMHNVVVYRMAKALARAGVVTLRFNYRGVGASTGRSEASEAELGDVAAAVGLVASLHPTLPVWTAGFSFGAWAAARFACDDRGVAGVLGVALVTSWFDFSPLRGCGKPKAFVQPADDELVALADVRALLATVPGPTTLEVVERARHMFAGQLDDLDAALGRAIAFLLDPR